MITINPHPPRCSVCSNRHYGICPNAPNFDAMKAVVERDAELCTLRITLAMVLSPQNQPVPEPAPRALAPTGSTKVNNPRVLVPGTARYRVLEHMKDGKEWTSLRLSEALGIKPNVTASACSRMAREGRIVRAGMDPGSNATLYRWRGEVPPV